MSYLIKDAERLAAVLIEHHWGDDTAQVGRCAMLCGCGKYRDEDAASRIYDMRARHDAHRADALSRLVVPVASLADDEAVRRALHEAWVAGTQQSPCPCRALAAALEDRP